MKKSSITHRTVDVHETILFSDGTATFPAAGVVKNLGDSTMLGDVLFNVFDPGADVPAHLAVRFAHDEAMTSAVVYFEIPVVRLDGTRTMDSGVHVRPFYNIYLGEVLPWMQVIPGPGAGIDQIRAHVSVVKRAP